MRKLPRIGTRVSVPFGLGKAEGEVVDTYEGALGPYVVVEVDLGGGATLTVDFKLNKVEMTDAA